MLKVGCYLVATHALLSNRDTITKDSNDTQRLLDKADAIGSQMAVDVEVLLTRK